ncbi:unnamed protein product [Leptosia nina]|uniref:Uncharacterized protein n=1 Tax=Leptosia nina TaxID=320188 RepID=A0AAV1IWV2_9NEOP
MTKLMNQIIYDHREHIREKIAVSLSFSLDRIIELDKLVSLLFLSGLLIGRSRSVCTLVRPRINRKTWDSRWSLRGLDAQCWPLADSNQPLTTTNCRLQWARTCEAARRCRRPRAISSRRRGHDDNTLYFRAQLLARPIVTVTSAPANTPIRTGLATPRHFAWKRRKLSPTGVDKLRSTTDLQ